MRRVAAGLSLILVLSLVLWPGCGKDSKSTSGGDVIPPASVHDLAVAAFSDSTALLTWTASGDDDTAGTATRYDVRYSTYTDSMPFWWDSLCTAAEVITRPKTSGEPESLRIGGLLSDTTYSFALRASDDVPNWSQLSNIAYGWWTDQPVELDTIPPARVTDLAILSAAETEVTLTWTAPGDDGMTGTAGLYDIRYSIGVLDEDDWDQAEIASGIPTPQPAGSSETFTISGLVPDTSYSFGVRASDEAGNGSGLSDVVSARTSTPPPPDTIPPARIAYLYVASRGPGRVFLAWVATGDDGESGRAAGYDIRHSQSPIDEATWGEAVPVPRVPVPGTPGRLDSLIACGIPEGSRLFAIRVLDEAGNPSPLRTSSSVLVEHASFEDAPPAAIEDLAALEVLANAVTLGWTAPGDDGDTGKASHYDVRLATDRASVEAWDTAESVPVPEPPQAAGSPEILEVRDLDSRTTYFFGARTQDACGNGSPLSNIVEVRTQAGLIARPDTLSFPPTVDSASIRVTNNGDGQVTCSVQTDAEWVSSDQSSLRIPSRDSALVRIRVDRFGLLPGSYENSVRFASSADADTVRVLMEEDDRGIYGRVVEVIDALDRRRYPYSFTLDTTGVQAAMVSFDGRTLFTDSSGLVAFGELEPGPLSVQVSKPDYLALDTTLTLVPGADFLFFLAPPLVDYFPLQVGNRYTYAFRIFLEIGMSFRWSGKEEWEISGMTMTETDTVYAVQVRRWKVPSTSSDTVITDTAYTIHQAGNRIAMSVPRMSWDHVLCRRYYPDSSPEIVSVLTRGDIASYWDMSMMRGVGPRSWRAHGGFASNHWDYSWSLTDWAFPGRTARQK